jgi:peptidylprolyl isomerase
MTIIEEDVVIGGSFGQEPTVAIRDGASAPLGLTEKILQEGAGEVVKTGDVIEVNYHGVTWRGNVFDSSFSRNASVEFPIGVGMLIKAWDQVLVGKKVGSRVLISASPEFGYGEQGAPSAGIKGDDTLVFVVDIVDIK